MPFCNSTDADFHHSDFGQEGRCLYPEAHRQRRHAQTTSPFTPPDEDDLTFVVNSGPGLDTGCTFREGGPLVFSVKIPRVFGDIDKLLAAGLISEIVTLSMPAYDVDFADGERDVVSLNGTPLSGFLTGVNEVWKLNSFNIPINMLKFPTDPGEGGTAQEEDNVISIDIDINNDGWCVAIDWAAVAIQKAPLPVVLFHGILSSGDVWEPLWETELEKLGIPNDGNQNLGELGSIQSNADLIASRVTSSIDRWGVKKVNIVCHSKGGLDSRHYVENADNVANVIQIGTPNGGSPLADFIQRASLTALGILPTVLINLFAGPAGVQLTTPHMALYNLMHGSNSNVRYTALAGMYDAGCFALNPFCRPVDRLLLSISGSPGDTIVPKWSVHALGYTGKPSYSSSGADGSAKHSPLIQSFAVFNQLQGRVTSNRRNLQTSSTPEPDYQSTISLSGIMIQGGGFSDYLYIDGTTEAYIILLYPSGQLGFTLVSPDGTTIDPAYATSNPSIVGYEDSEVFGSKIALYALINPAVGSWQIQVTGNLVLEPQIPFAVSGLLLQPAITLKSSLASPSVTSGTSLVFVAEPSDSNGPIRGALAQVTVESPDGTLTTLNLMDDGLTPDAYADDGVYTGSFITTSQAGNYRAAVSVEGTVPPLFSREVFVLGSVSAATATVNNFSDAPLDNDSDGLFNQLVISFDVSVTVPGDFYLLAILTDSEGNEQNIGMTVSVSGISTLSVSFDGETIYNNGVDGPYTLSALRLAEESGFSVAVVVNLEDAYTTAPYEFTQFDRSALQVKGGTTIPMDLNSNGLFDRLDVSLDVETVSSGFYEWSATLRDSLGTEIDFDSGSATFSAESNSFILMFDGTLIGDNRVDGPYFVSDLLLYGAGESLVQSTGVYTTDTLLASQFESTLPPPTVSPSATPTVDPCNDPINFCGKSNKVQICHKGKKSRCVRSDKLDDYLNEGSSCGVCPNSNTSAKSQKNELFSR
eukprot:CAMPEP_0171328720 /NCGR_PEP_ID=MMETSP0878-20121228/813_1 /TAXON_ID=67004 /ORGANISM="Thalassiosira weissflogii, Strain CCMP1336" /LENGTH=981 /DNA_ID=CAMNT_0011828589 /DNA_START=116 /DNA_END=3061 /DNA_ORIENTATION=+